MVVLFAIKNFEMLWTLLHICVLNNFGHIRLTEEEYRAKVANRTITDVECEAYNEPGPFSIYTYLNNMLKPGFYGDKLCLFLISMIWKVCIMVCSPYSSFEHGLLCCCVFGCCLLVAVVALGNVVRVYPETVQGLTFYHSKI